MMRSGPGGRLTLPIARPRNSKPPCERCPKIPDGAPPRPESAREFGDKEWRVYRHYLTIKAVGPTDAERRDLIVRRNAAVLSQVEQQFYQETPERLSRKLDSLIMALLMRR